MAYSIQFDDGSGDEDEQTFSLGSGDEMARLTGWAETLPASGFPAIRALIAEGLVEGTDRIAEEMGRIADGFVPDDPNVAETLSRLRERVGVGDAGESALII